jgi:predicted amidohydrolase
MITIAAWPLERQQHFETLLEARAIENQCYSIGVNQVGVCNGVEYGGGSAFISPKGVPLVRKYSDEGIAFANIDTDKVELTRREFPVFD